MKNRSVIISLTILCLSGLLFSCNKTKKLNKTEKKSSKTGVKFGEEGGFEPEEFKKQKPAPGMVLIPGGTFIMGGAEKDIEFSLDNRERQVSVQSFYMDETEIANLHWKEFLFDITANEGEQKANELLPDTTVWLRDLAFNDPIMETYYSHPAFNMYPVVGVTWHEVNEYCKWRTQKVNDKLLEEDEEAILYPSFRLPTEAEWEYAARALLESEVYSWAGKSLRNKKGQFYANFKRGRGDYAGWQGDKKHFTDGYMITAPIYSFWPNDFGLYNMSGNVAEWTQDTYRILSLEDVDDLNPYRRKGRTEIRQDDWLDDITYQQKNSLLFNPDPNAPVGNDLFDNIKVYRGGSWADIAYYLSPGSRRYYNADSCSAMIGFRCAMIKVGSPN